MRICLLSKEYPPDTGWGGIGTYNYQIAHGLKEIGHEVEVIALAKSEVPLSSNSNLSNSSQRPVHEEDGIIVHRVPWQGHMDKHSGMRITAPVSHFMFKTNLLLWNKLLAIHSLRPFDVLETPEHLAEGLIPAVAKWLPVVIKLHTPYSKFIAEKFHNTTAAFDHQLIAMLERLAIVSADTVISPSHDLARYLFQDMNYPLSEIKVVKNPIDANKFMPEGHRAISADGHLTVLYVGRLEERKGIHYLIESIPHILAGMADDHLSVRFVIIGSDTATAAGHQPVLPQLEQALSKSGCAGNVIFLPHVPLSDMPAYYRSADICIAPSLYDNAPYTCLEAMSCGRPLIGTNAGGMPEYITDGESGLVIPAADTGAIVSAVTRLLKNKEERLRLGENARQYILEKIHRTEIARENEAIYKLAMERFNIKKEKAIYRHCASQSLADANNMFYAYQTMLYNLLYVHSWRFRIQHWLKLLACRRNLLFAKLVASASNKVLGSRASQSALIAGLEKQIKDKENERELLVKLELGCFK